MGERTAGPVTPRRGAVAPDRTPTRSGAARRAGFGRPWPRSRIGGRLVRRTIPGLVRVGPGAEAAAERVALVAPKPLIHPSPYRRVLPVEGERRAAAPSGGQIGRGPGEDVSRRDTGRSVGAIRGFDETKPRKSEAVTNSSVSVPNNALHECSAAYRTQQPFLPCVLHLMWRDAAFILERGLRPPDAAVAGYGTGPRAWGEAAYGLRHRVDPANGPRTTRGRR